MKDLILVKNLVFDLQTLIKYYDTGFEEFVDVLNDESLKRDWLVDNISIESMELLTQFRNNWIRIINEVPYSNFGVFMNLDRNWRGVIEKYLIPCIFSLVNDIKLVEPKFKLLGKVELLDVEMDVELILKVVSNITKTAIKNDYLINPFYNLKN